MTSPTGEPPRRKSQRITPTQIQTFYQALQQGLNVKQAATHAGVSYAWAKLHLSKQPAGARAFREKQIEGRIGGPIPYDKLCDRAKRGLTDFDFFRQVYLGHMPTPWQKLAAEQVAAMLATDEKEYVVLNMPPGSGKALALDTPIPTPTGWSTIKDLAVGDWVYGDDGRPCRVVAKSEVFYDHDCYEVRTDDGASVIANAAHEWPVRVSPPRPGRGKPWYPGKTGPKPSPDGVHVRTTADLAKPRGKRPMLAVAPALWGYAPDLPLDPYLLGVWLGDGHTDGGRITSHRDDAPHYVAEAQRAGFPVKVTPATGNTVTLSMPKATETCGRGHARPRGGNCRECNTLTARLTRNNIPMPPLTDLSFHSLLRRLDVLGNKHIPPAYLRAGRNQRLALLQGLIDTDGHVGPNGAVEFCATNRRLAEATLELVRSLGVKAGLAEGRSVLNGVDHGPRYRVTFYMADAARLPRKAERCRNGQRTPNRYLTATPVESVPTQCVQVDSPSHLYLAGEGFMVTHNSTMLHDVACWMTVRNRAIRGLMGAATSRKANQFLGRIRRSLERITPVKASDEDKRRGVSCDAESTLARDYGLFKPPVNGDLWRADAFVVLQHGDELIDEKEPTWSAYGMDQDFLGGRFDLVFWDDLVTKKSLKTAEAIESQRDWYDSEAESRLEPAGAFFLVGQRLGALDLYRHALDKKLDPEDDAELEALENLDQYDRKAALVDQPGKYRHIVYRAHDEARCAGEHKRDDPYWPDGCLLDPFRLSWRELRGIRANSPEKYATVYQQEDADPKAAFVKSVWISGGTDPDEGTYHPGCWDNDRQLQELPDGLIGPKFRFVTVDPSPTKMWSIQDWVYAPAAAHSLFLMETLRVSMPANELLDWNNNTQTWYGVMEEWQNRSVRQGMPIRDWIFENNAAQRWFYQFEHCQRWQQHHQINVRPHTTTIRKNDADLGVEMIRDWWRFGRIRLPGKGLSARTSSLKLVSEVSNYPSALTDDQVMGCYFAVLWLPQLSSGWDVVEVPKFNRPSWLKVVA